MRTGDEQTLADQCKSIRRREGLSQSELAERAGVSTKTIQRLESSSPIAGSSRRAVLEALDLDPADFQPVVGLSHSWAAVEDSQQLLTALGKAQSVEIELDRQGWRQARLQRPWYRRDAILTIGDPVDFILDIVDRVVEQPVLPPGQAARHRDKLSEALRVVEAMSWRLATQMDATGRLSLYIGSPITVAERTASQGPEQAAARCK